MTKRAKGNIDYINGVLIPTQSYALTGRQWGYSSDTDVNGKKPTDCSPMVITAQPPGAFAKTDESWLLTFGASHDAWLSLFNSAFMANSPPTLTEDDVHGKGFGHAKDFNLFRLANDVQQIAYVVNKNTPDEFRDSPKIVDENSARSIGFRFPNMAAGYGKTVGLRPTDPDPQDARKNDEEHKIARETWKHGPIIGRWDERSGSWSVYNDLITGQHQESLGTLVHSTNSNEEEGFPFLKGKITDAWWVRKTIQQVGVNGKDGDFDKSGEVCTHLEHRLYDDVTKTVAALSSIFTIPGPNAASCHEAPQGPTTVGDEETYDGTLIDLKHSVHFNMDGTDKDGPFNFSVQTIPPEEICSPSEGTYHLGTVYFNDEGCVWDVAVKIDECELAGGHLAKLAANDVSIAERLSFICNFITSWGGGGGAISLHQPSAFSFPTVHDINFGTVAAAVDCLQSNIISANKNAISNATAADTAMYASSTDYAETIANQVITAINTWITSSLVPILVACCGESAGALGTLAVEFVSPSAPQTSLIPPEYLDCSPILLPAPTLNCEYCFGVHLNVPCGEAGSVFAGDACFINEPPVPITKYGSCQTHEI